ncbi:hypothetical protein F4781DRAFT_418035 [Annulohypoxylon bovei var. microspora]|nr:hypothetical protein F4781DRAFT_418035 [Annulohypoxylon bovei var. microspora]
MVRGHKNKFFKSYQLRLEKVDLTSRSWWRPNGASAHDAGEFEVGRYSCESRQCSVCNKSCKEIFKQGWTCLNKDCLELFKFPKVPSMENSDFDQLEYNENFLRERTEFGGIQFQRQLIPELPEVNDHNLGSEKEFKQGIVCRVCGCCCRRIKWEGWFCENPTCNFTHNLPLRMVSLENIAAENGKVKLKYRKTKFVHDKVLKIRMEPPMSTCKVTTYFLPDDDRGDGFIGSVTRIRPEAGVLQRQGGINELYSQFQEFDLGLERRGAKNAGGRIEELTSHFNVNYGAPYKFGVVVKTTTGLPDARPPIVETLLRLDWAGRTAASQTIELIQDKKLSVGKDVIPSQSKQFNELLVLGYFEGSNIRPHDDGERELGPTVATLSLGSTSVMKFIPKKGVKISDDNTNKEAKTANNEPAREKPAKNTSVLSLILKHGDILVMHGARIQERYLHSVSNLGKHRFAMTCRYIRPETIPNEEQRNLAEVNGKLSDDWSGIQYDGEDDRFVSRTTGKKVTCPGFVEQSNQDHAHQAEPIEHRAQSGDIQTQDSSSTPTL